MSLHKIIVCRISFAPLLLLVPVLNHCKADINHYYLKIQWYTGIQVEYYNNFYSEHTQTVA